MGLLGSCQWNGWCKSKKLYIGLTGPGGRRPPLMTLPSPHLNPRSCPETFPLHLYSSLPPPLNCSALFSPVMVVFVWMQSWLDGAGLPTSLAYTHSATKVLSSMSATPLAATIRLPGKFFKLVCTISALDQWVVQAGNFYKMLYS